MKSDCLFCKIVTNQINSERIYENDNVIVIKDKYPQAPIHYLIIPKNHYDTLNNLNSDKDGLEILKAAQYISSNIKNCSSFRLVNNTGAQSGQSIFHLHFHFLSGFGSVEKIV